MGVSASFPGSTNLWLSKHSNAQAEDYWGMALGTLYTSGNSYIQTLDKSNSSYYNLLLQPNGGNVGIGTATPSEKLHVHENLSTTNHQIAARIGGDTSSYNTLVFGSKDGRPHVGGHRGDYGVWADLSLQNDLMVLKQSTMSVGIGTSSPVAKLHVASNGPTYTAIGGNDRFRIEELVSNGNKFGLQMGIDWGTGHSALQTYALSSSGSYSQNYSLLLQPHGGHVGIGTNNPSAGKLDLSLIHI